MWIQDWLLLALYLKYQYWDTYKLELASTFLKPGLHYYGDDVLPEEWYSIPKLREHIFADALRRHLDTSGTKRSLVENVKILRQYTQTVRSDQFNYHTDNVLGRSSYSLIVKTLVGSELWNIINSTWPEVFSWRTYFEVIGQMMANGKLDPSNEDLIWFLGFADKPIALFFNSFEVLATHCRCSYAISLALGISGSENRYQCKLSVRRNLLDRNDFLMYYELIRLGCLSSDFVYSTASWAYPNSNTVDTVARYEWYSIFCASSMETSNTPPPDLEFSFVKCRIATPTKLAVSKLPLPTDIIFHISEFLWQVYTPDEKLCAWTQLFIRRILKDILYPFTQTEAAPQPALSPPATAPAIN